MWRKWIVIGVAALLIILLLLESFVALQ